MPELGSFTDGMKETREGTAPASSKLVEGGRDRPP